MAIRRPRTVSDLLRRIAWKCKLLPLTVHRPLCGMLEKLGHQTNGLPLAEELSRHVESFPNGLVIIDLDMDLVDSRFLRALKKKCPELFVPGLSDRPYHPELKEAMRQQIQACLRKPVDEDKLAFWVRSFIEG